MAENRGCRHSDIREFDGVTYCMSCGDIVPVEYGTAAAVLDPDRVPPLLEDHENTSGLSTFSIREHEFEYEHLDQSRSKKIRLIELLPGKYDAALRCNIIHADLESVHHPYRAMSYTWGDEDGDANLSKKILCGPQSRVLWITWNCYNALRCIRPRRQSLVIWVDMICINQNDTAERNHQVHLMAAIYEKAVQVYIYLGERDDASDLIFDFLAKKKKKTTVSNDDKYSLVSSRDGVRDFFHKRRWFGRVWVIQEVAMARSAVVFCGQKSLHWDRFLRGFAEIAKQVSGLVRPPPLDIGHHYDLQRRGLFELLLSTRSCASTDPRDKVFALLALVADNDAITLEADYTRCPEEIFLQIAVAITLHFKDSRIIRYVCPSQTAEHLRSIGDSPSWVPFWTTRVDSIDSTLTPLLEPGRQCLSDPIVVMGHASPIVASSTQCLDFQRFALGTRLQVHARKLAQVWANFESGGLLGTRIFDLEAVWMAWNSMPDWTMPFCRGNDQTYGPGFSQNSCPHFLSRHSDSPPSDSPPRGPRHSTDLLEDWNWSFWSFIDGRFQSRCGPAPKGLFDSFRSSRILGIPPCFRTRSVYDEPHDLMKAGPPLGRISCLLCRETIGDAYSRYFRDYGPRSLSSFIDQLHRWCDAAPENTWSGFATEDSLGIGPANLQDGCSVWLIGNDPQPFMLRPVEGGYRLVGPCYVHGLATEHESCNLCEGGGAQDSSKWETIEIW